MAINSSSYNTLFITEAVLKDNSVINSNVDMKTITPTIKLCQDKYIMPLIGSSLYADLQFKITSGSLNPDEVFLMKAYIQPVLVWAVMKESTLYTSFKYMNKGVSQQSSDNSNPVTLKDLQYLADNQGNNLDWYSQRLIDYLQANKGLFTAYENETQSNDLKPANTGFKSRLYLGNGSKCCKEWK